MDKPFKSIAEQIAILESRGLECDNDTRLVLEREGTTRLLTATRICFSMNGETPAKSFSLQGPSFLISIVYSNSIERCAC